MKSPFHRYGHIPGDRVDISGVPSASVDLRAETGGQTPDETKLVPPGTFTLSVFGAVGDYRPVGEIRLMVRGVEVRLVGALTGRPDVLEVTPDHLAACFRDPDGYRRQLVQWLGIAA